MADDLYVRLQKALDEAENLAGRTLAAHTTALGKVRWPRPLVIAALTSTAAGSMGATTLRFHERWDPSTVLRLIGHFRDMVKHHRPVVLTAEVPAVEYCMTDEQHWPCEEIQSAAEFWLTDTETTDRQRET